ncbi:hypothetical protein EDD85DRAFT_954734 [Armillaria nabsnona]|nr:hypothetical protein EDD85DRAFT_954734 [Armillaria nabsnona]
MDLLLTLVLKQCSNAQFFLALANHNNNQLYFSPSKTLSLTPNVTVEELRNCGELLDARPAEAVKLNGENTLALHFPVREDDNIPGAIELIFDIEKLDPVTVYPGLAASRARAKKPRKIIHEHTRKDIGNGFIQTLVLPSCIYLLTNVQTFAS